MTSRNADGVASVAPSSPRAYVSNYIPLWAELMADDSAASTNILQSFLDSGTPTHLQADGACSIADHLDCDSTLGMTDGSVKAAHLLFSNVLRMCSKVPASCYCFA